MNNKQYENEKKSAIKNFYYYIVFNIIFLIFNIIVIYSVPSYTFPKNFFAIWPIIGWGIPTLAKFIKLRRYK